MQNLNKDVRNLLLELESYVKNKIYNNLTSLIVVIGR